MSDPERYWYASLTGDLVCGYCDRMMEVHHGLSLPEGPVPCTGCKKVPQLTAHVLKLADERSVKAYPLGRPREGGSKWKGD